MIVPVLLVLRVVTGGSAGLNIRGGQAGYVQIGVGVGGGKGPGVVRLHTEILDGCHGRVDDERCGDRVGRVRWDGVPNGPERLFRIGPQGHVSIFDRELGGLSRAVLVDFNRSRVPHRIQRGSTAHTDLGAGCAVEVVVRVDAASVLPQVRLDGCDLSCFQPGVHRLGSHVVGPRDVPCRGHGSLPTGRSTDERGVGGHLAGRGLVPWTGGVGGAVHVALVRRG